jgi:hypothetical protein
MDVGLEAELNCISRSRYRMTNPCNIKALISRADRVVDLKDISGTATEEEIVHTRNVQAGDAGLLLLYPISKDSTPEADSDHELARCVSCGMEHQVPVGGAAVRHPLRAVSDIVGAALVFPRAKRPDADYMANDLPKLFTPDAPEEGELVPDESGELDG